MIHILAQFSVKEDKVSEFIELCKELIKESRQEEGCVAYNLQQNREKDNHLVFVEQWKSEKIYFQHFHDYILLKTVFITFIIKLNY